MLPITETAHPTFLTVPSVYCGLTCSVIGQTARQHARYGRDNMHVFMSTSGNMQHMQPVQEEANVPLQKEFSIMHMHVLKSTVRHV